METTLYIRTIALVARFGAVMLAAAVGSSVAAQSVESEAVKGKLSQKIHMRLGKTTLNNFATQLTEQIGLTVTPADYLRDRDMIVELDGVSARTALNALAELNDWKWKETPEHAISIARNLLKMPQTAAIPRVVQSAIPKDTRTFLQIQTPSADLTAYTNPLLSNVRALHNERLSKILRYLRETQADLFSTLPGDAPKGDPIPFERLTQVQQSDLIVQIAFRQLSLLDEYLLSDFLPFVADPRVAQLERFGNKLRVGIHVEPQRWTGFTADIRP